MLPENTIFTRDALSAYGDVKLVLNYFLSLDLGDTRYYFTPSGDGYRILFKFKPKSFKSNRERWLGVHGRDNRE